VIATPLVVVALVVGGWSVLRNQPSRKAIPTSVGALIAEHL